ncbi:carboxylesterase, partial [Pholiota conissans]
MKFFLLLKVLSLLRDCTSAQSIQDTSGLTVQTQQGAVAGTHPVPSVRQFVGIPFASAKRWQAPQLPLTRKTVFQATKFSKGCLQNLAPVNFEYLKLNGNDGTDVPSGEDCLSVNIWSPSVGRKQKTAVLLWIYGGGFVLGTSGIPVFNGTNMVRDNDDITLVTINYRLNIFGQPNAPQLGKNNVNFGLLDTDAAIQWVHANIANFGGDPERITIFGQSAGGAAVDAYTFTHPQDTIVKGIIEQSGSFSGTATGNDVVMTVSPTVNTDWNTIANIVGCGNDTTPQQFACMQAVPAQTLQKAVISSNASFFLVVDNTNERARAGKFLRVPLLVGSTANEEDIIIVAQQLVSPGFVLPVVTEIFSDALTALAFTCNASVTAVNRLNAGVPTFRYQYQGVFPSLSTRPDLRAYHSSEIPMIFGTYNSTVISGASLPPTPPQVALSKYIQSAWVAFARNPKQGLVDLGWPLYSPNTTSLAQLGGFFNQSGVVFGEARLIDAACNDATVQAALSTALAQTGPLLSG